MKQEEKGISISILSIDWEFAEPLTWASETVPIQNMRRDRGKYSLAFAHPTFCRIATKIVFVLEYHEPT